MTIKQFMREAIDDRKITWCGIGPHLLHHPTKVYLDTKFPLEWFSLICRPDKIKDGALICTSGENYRRVKG